jgi:hypothetical protein
VVTSQAIFHLTPLVIPPGILQTFNKLERSFFLGRHGQSYGVANAMLIGGVCL